MSMIDYSGREYLRRHPDYHVEDSRWKAAQILRMLARHPLHVRTVCDVGCGAGAVLAALQPHLPPDAELAGYDLSPDLAPFWSAVANERLTFTAADFLATDTRTFDLLLCLDVFEHVPDYLGFLRALHPRAVHKLFHIPLDMTVQAVLRGTPIRENRRTLGHLHYFSKETALLTLQDAGYTVIDWMYTPSGVERATSRAERLVKWPRRLAAALSAGFAARVLGGYSLLVLAR